MLFDPLTIHNVTFKNRILRSSIGGKTSYYDGTVSPAWQHFERRFAAQGVAALVSPTISVHDRRWSPLNYPKLSDDRFIAPIREGVRGVQAHGCRWGVTTGRGSIRRRRWRRRWWRGRRRIWCDDEAAG